MRRWGRRLRAGLGLLALTLLVMLTAVPGASSAPAPDRSRIHPYLMNLAQRTPDAMVNVQVMLEKGADERTIERASGGKRTQSWPFIHAMQVRVPARGLKGLAQLPGVEFISPDSPLRPTDIDDQANLATDYQAALNVQPFWQAQSLGRGVGVAVIDTGVAAHPDLVSHTVNVVLPAIGQWQDAFGHGTHVAGIIAGNAGDSFHIGVAPDATIYNLRVTDNDGNGTEGTLISALQWVYENHTSNNIRVVNISMQSSVASSYLTSPLAAAAEQLWFAGVVVVVSAGNRGSATDALWYPPANDPYVITVGAMDDHATVDRTDDLTTSFSSLGTTQEGRLKPDLLAPGRRILAPLAPGSVLSQQFPEQVEGAYIRLSGSSMAAPTIAGAAAVMLSRQPGLTPDQVKYALMHGVRSPLQGQLTAVPPTPDLAQVFTAITDAGQVPAANQGLTPSGYIDPVTGTMTQSNVYYDNVYYDNVYYTNVSPSTSVFGY